MQFTSFEFLIFFPVVVLLYYIMPRRLRQFWLLLASYYFYMSWNAKYGILILASTVITYLCALLIARMKVQEAQGKTKRKLILITAIITNLALLVFFKYFYFLHDTAAMVSSIFGVELKESRLEIVLPVGISFYTFQALGYTIDVYRGTVKAEKNFIRYALFVSFFPQLVAGPIERSKNLLWQIENMQRQRIGSFEKITRGLLLMLWGFFMKMVIADRAAVLVNQVFDVYYLFDGVALLITSVLFAVQIYCDFASYSIIAMGAAKVLGIELMVNFEAPFFSTSIRKLWRRWHVSLSSWFRDYLYIPMGGSRCSKPRKYLNTLITFLASGFWHGASWHFVVWGAIQGIYIIIGDLLDPLRKWVDTVFHVRWKTLVCQFCRGVCTFLLFAFSFVFFRADTVKDAIYFLQRMVQNFDVWFLFDESIFYLGLDRKEMGVLLFGILLLLIVDACYAAKHKLFDAIVKEQCLAVQYIVVAVLLVMVLIFGVYGEGYDASQFIYFQF
jgi:Predicted membrane protein involved in D-alanine export